MKFSDYKKQIENKLNNILENFKEKTGVSINYIDFNKKMGVGFNKTKSIYETKIILKNE